MKVMCQDCLALVEDPDGFGRIVHDGCGDCSHPDVYGNECQSCGWTVPR